MLFRNLQKENIMKTKQTAPQNIDDYIAGFPNDVQDILEKIRITIRKAAPAAKEAIKYQIPTFTMKGNLVHFAAYKNHIGFYPAPLGIEKFKKGVNLRKRKRYIKIPIR
jgi:uncharacterized protein YdhG (YjbR/CyaY superfamily)